MNKLALYFGFVPGSGHFLSTPDGKRDCGTPKDLAPGIPWVIGDMDTGLLTNMRVPDHPDGRVHWACGGRPDFWFAFVWWDRSGDKRGASNSGFYVRWPLAEVTRETVQAAAPEAFAFACAAWPQIVARQPFPLVLTDLPPATSR